MNIYDRLQERRAEITVIDAKHGTYNVRVFVSVARHEADSASGLDLLVEMGPENGLRGCIREHVLKEATAS